MMSRRFLCLGGLTVALFVASVRATPSQAKDPGKDLELKVGVVQRFGDESQDQLTLKGGNEGEVLTFVVQDEQGQSQTLKGRQATIEMTTRPLAQPVLQERLVLSDHATFETAEDSANQWKALGLEVEVTQPDRWQVWAKQSVYDSPLVRRWLLQSLKDKGYTKPYLTSEVVKLKPQAVLKVEGKTYPTDNLTITAPQNLIQVTENRQKTRLYGGKLQLQPNAYGHYTLVNQVP
ncbi:MAG: amidase, partial [Microcystaceae cyanobacterium]